MSFKWPTYSVICCFKSHGTVTDLLKQKQRIDGKYVENLASQKIIILQTFEVVSHIKVQSTVQLQSAPRLDEVDLLAACSKRSRK